MCFSFRQPYFPTSQKFIFWVRGLSSLGLDISVKVQAIATAVGDGTTLNDRHGGLGGHALVGVDGVDGVGWVHQKPRSSLNLPCSVAGRIVGVWYAWCRRPCTGSPPVINNWNDWCSLLKVQSGIGCNCKNLWNLSHQRSIQRTIVIDSEVFWGYIEEMGASCRNPFHHADCKKNLSSA